MKFNYLVNFDLTSLFHSLFVNFERLQQLLLDVTQVSRNYIDTTAASVNISLPAGVSSTYDYLYVKTDSSANTVTITPAAGEFINATTSLTLSTQGASAWLVFDTSTQTWWTV